MTYAEDLVEITALPHRYCSGINRADYAAIASCFAEDAEWSLRTPDEDGQPIDRHLRGGQQVADLVRNAYEETFQFVTQLVGVVDIVSIEGDVGHLFTFFEARSKAVDGSSFYLIGVYDDYVARFPAGWRFARRIGRTVYMDHIPLPGLGFHLAF